MSRLPVSIISIVVALIVCKLMSPVLGAETQPDTANPLTGTDIAWSTIQTANFTIYFHKDFAEDAQKARTYLERTIDALRQEFAEHSPEKILDKIDCHFYLQPEPNELAFDGQSLCRTRGLSDGTVHSELHFLTRGRYRPDSLNSVGEPKAADHTFHRYIVHEYASIWLGIISRDKKKGWRVNGNDAPNWFWQGYQEYLGMTLSTPHSRTVTFAKYMAAVKNDPDSVLLARGHKDKTLRIVVQRDYTDGFALLAFMHDRFGRKAVQSILTSQQETFWQAMNDAFGVEAEKFYEDYQSWDEDWTPTANALMEQARSTGTD
jgi:hypothetical protein